jgi:prevent-host-death family protein
MEVGVLEAKNRLSELIERAERGEQIVITRHGQPAVEFTPVRKRLTAVQLDNLMEEVKRARESLPPITLEEIVEIRNEGREERYRRIFSR